MDQAEVSIKIDSTGVPCSISNTICMSTLSHSSSIYVCLLVRLNNASVLNKIPFMNMAALNCIPISKWYIPNDISFSILITWLISPIPLSYLIFTLSSIFPFDLKMSQIYFSELVVDISLELTFRFGQLIVSLPSHTVLKSHGPEVPWSPSPMVPNSNSPR